MNFKEYRRIYPKLRLSWSLYKLWVSKDWIQVWNYLIGNEEVETEKQQLGSKVHDFIETTGCQFIQGIDMYIGKNRVVHQEIPVVLERDDYTIVMRPDLFTDDTDSNFVVDWKTGKSGGYAQQLQLYMWGLTEAYNKPFNYGYLIELDTDLKDEEIAGIKIRKVKQYEKSKYANEWELRLFEMGNDIRLHLPQLIKYIKQTK